MTKNRLIVLNAQEAESVITATPTDAKTATIPGTVYVATDLAKSKIDPIYFLDSMPSQFKYSPPSYTSGYNLAEIIETWASNDYSESRKEAFNTKSFKTLYEQLPFYHWSDSTEHELNHDQDFDFAQPVADVLEVAADKIEQFGWTQKKMGSTEIGFCAVGAIRSQIGQQQKLINIALAWFTKYLLDSGASAKVAGMPSEMTITTWNDHLPDEFPVIDALRRAAKEWRNNQEGSL